MVIKMTLFYGVKIISQYISETYFLEKCPWVSIDHCHALQREKI